MAISELEAIIELAPQIAHCALVGSRSLLRPAPFEADNKPSLEVQSNSRRLFLPNG